MFLTVAWHYFPTGKSLQVATDLTDSVSYCRLLTLVPYYMYSLTTELNSCKTDRLHSWHQHDITTWRRRPVEYYWRGIATRLSVRSYVRSITVDLQRTNHVVHFVTNHVYSHPLKQPIISPRYRAGASVRANLELQLQQSVFNDKSALILEWSTHIPSIIQRVLHSVSRGE